MPSSHSFGCRAFDHARLPKFPRDRQAAKAFSNAPVDGTLVMKRLAQQPRSLDDEKGHGGDLTGAVPAAPMIPVVLRQGGLVTEMAGRQCHAADRMADGRALRFVPRFWKVRMQTGVALPSSLGRIRGKAARRCALSLDDCSV